MNEKFIPLVYLLATAAVACGFHVLGVPDVVTGGIIGAGITRIRIGEKTRNGGSHETPNPESTNQS